MTLLQWEYMTEAEREEFTNLSAWNWRKSAIENLKAALCIGLLTGGVLAWALYCWRAF